MSANWTATCESTLIDVARHLRTKEISPTELTKAMLERIARLDPALHSYLTLTPEVALRQARQAEQEIQAGQYRGPLHGVPVGIKDLCYTRGVKTTCASQILANWVPDHDATVVEKLAAAGAVMLGKLNMTEFAYGGYHPSLPVPVNPWAPDRWPGASSSGSAVATAAALCFASLGSDTGGSIRFPAAACGIVGVKPTYGRVSRFGVFPLAESLDHIGPMTRSVADAGAVLAAIGGFDPRDPTTRRDSLPNDLAGFTTDLRGLTIGLDERYCTEGTDPEVTRAVLATAPVFRDLGARLHTVNVTGIVAAADDWYAVCAVEAAAAHEAYFPARAAEYGPTFRALLEDGERTSARDYAKAQFRRREVCRIIDDLWQDVDLLLCPSMPTPPPPLAELRPDAVLPADAVAPLLRFTAPFDFTGSPTISVPCGFTAVGLPLSLQIVGRHGDEATILRAGHAFEQATDWHRRRPTV